MTTSSSTTMLHEVLKIEKADHYKDPVVYEFSNEEKKTSTDKTDSGIYDGT